MRHRLLAIVCTALLLGFFPATPRAAAQGSDGRPDQVLLQPPSRLLPGVAGAGSSYLSPATQAAHPFTHMLLRRVAHVPDGAMLTLYVRASVDGLSWGAWTEVLENDDLWADSDGPDVFWSQTLDAGGLARFWQVRGDLSPTPDGTLPELREIAVETVDATVPTPTATPPQLAGAVAKPAVVSRNSWGSPDGEGSRATPAYYPVNHMVVHHTADSNTLLPGEPNWAARVRAEWSFHTYTRGWGDVGYNYLIDPNGVIYEGRAGGDDVIAFHDTGNYGSMGVVLIGTYATVPPTAKAQDSLVSLLAWKAGQKQIDPLGSSYYYGCAVSQYCQPWNPGAIVPNIAGHRQVTPGHTSCPGDQTIAYLPSIRNRVKQALSGSPTANTGDLVIDELESGFARSNSTWHEADCGYGGHTYWTFANGATAENSATWRPNIPSSGTYRVYAHIPQGCGLAPPPYASIQARYNIAYAGGTASISVDQNTATAWVDLGAYQFNQGTSGAVELFDNTGEPLGAGRVLFFDAVKWVPENAANTNVQLLGVAFDRGSLPSGELLKVTFTVKNTGSTTIHTQSPQASLTADGQAFNDGRSGRPDDGYVYDEGECFSGDSAGSYASYPKESDRFRLVLGPADTSGVACADSFGGYPWRWGLNGDLAPGQTRDVVGYVRFRNSGLSNRVVTLRANIIQEYVKYYYDQSQGFSTATATILPDQVAPDSASYDSQLTPLARVYRLGRVPDNLLARTRNSLSVPRGTYIGSFAWDGQLTHWGAGGPLGQTDQFMVEQTRVFLASSAGEYSFRSTSDDGSWLWVDGKPVVQNNGLHDETTLTGTITLAAGPHVLAYKYFERSGDATAGYDMRGPGEPLFHGFSDGLGGGAARLGAIYIVPPDLSIAADDLGGIGVDRLRWSWDGVNWQESAGQLLRLGRLGNGSYRLRYQAIDKAGNMQGQPYELAFTVNTELTVYRAWAPMA